MFITIVSILSIIQCEKGYGYIYAFTVSPMASLSSCEYNNYPRFFPSQQQQILRRTAIYSSNNFEENDLNVDVEMSVSSTIEESQPPVDQRYDLSSQFQRWKILQDILEEEESPSARDINEILYMVLKSFLDFPRPRKLPTGQTNPSPTLNEEQRKLLVDKLLRHDYDSNHTRDRGWIDAIPTDEYGNDSMEYDVPAIIEINDLLERFQPDREEEEEAFKSCWDLVLELYGREATKMSEQSGDTSWKVRSGIVRLLIHFDFLAEWIEEYNNQ